MSTYGDFQVHIADDQTDIVGIRTVILYQSWQASHWPMTLDELDTEEPAVPPIPGGLWLIGRQRRRFGGVLRTFWTFEGIHGTGDRKDVTFKGRRNSPDYGFAPGFSEVPIQQNKRIDTIIDRFEGQVMDDQVIFPPTYGESGKANPLFGRKSYFSFEGGVYYYRYLARDPSELPDIIEKVFTTSQLPGRPPLHQDRNWLCAGIPWKTRGPFAIEAQEIYWLSGDGGWPPAPVYKRGTVAA